METCLKYLAIATSLPDRRRKLEVPRPLRTLRNASIISQPKSTSKLKTAISLQDLYQIKRKVDLSKLQLRKSAKSKQESVFQGLNRQVWRIIYHRSRKLRQESWAVYGQQRIQSQRAKAQCELTHQLELKRMDHRLEIPKEALTAGSAALKHLSKLHQVLRFVQELSLWIAQRPNCQDP